nr:heavy metal translocating P-type ATPase [uncultured Dysosmobacter sp.]
MTTLSKKQRKMRNRILIAAALLVLVKLLPLTGWIRGLCCLAPYFIIGYDVLRKAALGIINGQVFDENFLMALATVGAYATGEFDEAVFVMLFYQTGELFQDYAVGKSRSSIAALMDIRPDTAHLETESGLETVDPEDVAVGSVIVVKPGERVPLDGTVLEGSSTLDTAALTGESLPRSIRVGDDIISGCVNLTGLLRVTVTKPCEESTVSKILELVENSSEKKAVSEQFITRFAKYYTPCVVYAALALFLIPTILLAALPTLPGFLAGTVWTDWLHRALTFLVISCPCALVISVPLSFFGGIGGASKCGILVKGGNYLEALAKADTVVFDKTGTLTKGTFAVSAVHPEAGFEADQVLEYAALAEQYSTHPIAVSLREACKSGMDRSRVANVEEIAGHGIMAEVDGKRVGVGNSRLMERQSVNWLPCELPGTIVHVTIDGFYAGHIVIADQPKPDAKEAIARLKALGVKRTVMLTGDTREVAHTVADALGLDEYHAELLPADKVARVEGLLKQETGKLAFVGDGINDAPVLTRADIGIAMGGLGSDAAIEAADIVLMDDQPTKIAAAIRIARKTVRIVRENIVFALTVKAIVLVMGALGKAPMWLAVFADVGVAFLAILNAMRCLYTEKDKK